MNLVTIITKAIKRSVSIDPVGAEALAYFYLGAKSKCVVMNKVTGFYMLLIGPSSVSHKTSAARMILKHLEYRALSTPTAMEEYLSTSFPSYPLEKVFYEDEFSRFLKKRGTWKSVVDILNTCYGGLKRVCFPKRGNRRMRIMSQLSVPCLLALSTIENLKGSLRRDVLEGGLFKRMMVFDLEVPPYVPQWDLVEEDITIKNLPFFQEIFISDNVKEIHEDFMRCVFDSNSHDVLGFWQRAEGNIFKLAAVHAYCERESLEIEQVDYKKALKLATHSLACQLKLREII